jgi:hypothetical protein
MVKYPHSAYNLVIGPVLKIHFLKASYATGGVGGITGKGGRITSF